MKGFMYTGLERETALVEGENDGQWESLVIDAVGNVIEFWGFKRNQGRVWALIYLRGHPMTAAEIQDALGLSKGAVSMIVRELERWQVLSRVRSHTSSSWLFQAETDLKTMMFRVFRERESVFISRVRADLAAAERLAEKEGVDAEVLERLRRMRSLADAMGKAVDAFVASAKLDLGVVVDLLRGTSAKLGLSRKNKSRRGKS